MRIPCTIMRGGTSKAVFFMENALPKDPETRKRIILRAMGSPDRRQIDGLGGADLLTSKVAIIGPPSRPDADVDYTFGQVAITEPEIYFDVTCGNISSAVGPFAIDQGLLRAQEPITRVRINCLPSRKLLVAQIEVKDNKVVEEGDFAIDGVPGTGSKIVLDWSDTAGALTGRLLPTGQVRQTLDVPKVGQIEASIVDAGNLAVFVYAKSLGLKGTESPLEIDNNRPLVQKINTIRRHVAEQLGYASLWRGVTDPVLPLLCIVQSPVDSVNFATGHVTKAEEMDILSKIYAAGMTHKAYGGSPTISTGAAAKIEGSIVHELLSESGRAQSVVRIGHPSGVIPIEVAVTKVGGTFRLDRAEMCRTARRIIDGWVYV